MAKRAPLKCFKRPWSDRRQPYAQAIACGLKRIETHGQRTRYRDRLAIHAALGHALPFAFADLYGVLAEY